MVELNRAQISSLANRIANELNLETKKTNEVVLGSQEYMDFDSTNPDSVLLREIALRNGLALNHSGLQSMIGSIKTNAFSNRIVKVRYYSQSDIENEIILGTIDGENLSEICESVKDRIKLTHNN